MSKEICLSHEKKREIIKMFKVSRVTLWSALTYKTESKVADMLRAAALQRGGVLINGDGASEPNLKFDTYFNEVPHEMVQVFSPRVRIVANLEHGGVVLMADGKVVKSFKTLQITELPKVQAEAQMIVNNLK